ncbi:hypothetical protein T484DRAFT_2020081 [Baffinella frigidus]|nr:hypothetical protein T484DRAFT_2020081 [Cryptophyta sp. CCMP2293]
MLAALAGSSPHEHICAHDMSSGMGGFIEVLGGYEDEFDDDDWDDDEDDRQGDPSPSNSEWVSQYDMWLQEDAEKKEERLDRKIACEILRSEERAINERLRPSSPVNVGLGSITYVPRREAPQHHASQTGSGVVVTKDGERYESIAHWLQEAFNKKL